MSGDAVVATKNPVPILQRRADLPDGLAGVVDKALAGDEEPAFARAADLRRALVEAWKG
jgi:hypothetical protein